MRKYKSVLAMILTAVLSLNTVQFTYATNTSATQETQTAGDTAANTAQGNTGDTEASEAEASQQDEGVVDKGESWPEAPVLSAGSAILIDADTCTILYEKNSHAKAYPASVTKLMTALLTVENCSLSETVTFSADAQNSVTWEDAKLDIQAGEQLTVEQAMYALLLKSANDVAYGLAEHVAGSIPEFVNMMNNRAQELGALNTHFNNASGLSDPDHYTTAYDIAMIARACMNNPTIVTMMNTKSYVIAPTNLYGYERTVSQRHEMLMPSSQYYYEYAKGGKTGFTDESKYTLCTFASKDDMNLIAVVFLCETAEDRFVDTKALFEYGFNNFQKLTLDSTQTSSLLGADDYYNSSIFGGQSLSFALASSAVTVPNGVESSDVEMVVDREAASGDTFATVRFEYGGNVVGTSQLYASSTSNASETTRPSNLPYLNEKETTPIIVKDYIVFNAYYIMYGVIFVTLLLIMLFGLLFMNYSEYGREMMKTRRRRKGYRGRKLRF